MGNLIIKPNSSGTLNLQDEGGDDAFVVSTTGGVSGSIVKDEDTLSSNSATHLATQQSIKAYVDNVIGFSAYLAADITVDTTTFTWHATRKIINGVTESSGTITCPTAGKYFVNLVISGESSTASAHWFSARVYGGGNLLGTTALLGNESTEGAYLQGAFAGLFDLAADDTVYVNSSASGGFTLFGGTQTPRFSLIRIGA